MEKFGIHLGVFDDMTNTERELTLVKKFIQTDLFKFASSLTKVNFVETYENKQAPKSKSEEKPKSK